MNIMRSHLLHLLLVSLYLAARVKGRVETEEHRLLGDLFDGYSKIVRPVLNRTKPLVLDIGLAIVQIYDFDFRNQMISLNLWQMMKWTDEFLVWDPSQYDGVSRIFINSDLIWTSDVSIYNEAGSERAEVGNGLVEVASDGRVRMEAPIRPTISCELEVTYFPWDQQKCSISFGSLMRDKSTLDIFNQSDKIEIFTYKEHGEWEIVNTSATKGEAKFGCCPYPVPFVSFGLHLKRRPTYYLANLIIPCIVITLTALLTFCLPPDSGEKISLSVTVLLATTVFLLVVNESMPVQSLSAPYISLYFLSVMSLLVLSLVSTVIVLSVHHKGVQGRRPPKWLKYVLLKIISPMLLISPPDIKVMPATKNKTPNAKTADKNITILEDEGKINDNHLQEKDTKLFMQERANLERIAENMDFMANHIKEKEEQGDVSSEWETCARVLDRFFFVTYLLILAVLSFAFLLRRP